MSVQNIPKKTTVQNVSLMNPNYSLYRLTYSLMLIEIHYMARPLLVLLLFLI